MENKKGLAPVEYYEYGVHLWVLVHGYQGNSKDMKMIKNNISLAFPEVMCLESKINEEHTEGNIA
jgi:hypothetical protein